eukprot:1189729-Amphidinium_carterae.1
MLEELCLRGSEAYEKLCDSAHTVCYRSWMAGLHVAWVTHAEAAPWFVLFEKDRAQHQSNFLLWG